MPYPTVSAGPRSRVCRGASGTRLIDMGLLIYANSTPGFEFDDRSLTHLKIVIYAKLRRNESFGFSWQQGPEQGGGRNSVWLDAAIPLRFVFFGGRAPTLNRTWLEQLAVSAGSPTGLVLLAEPPDLGHGHD